MLRSMRNFGTGISFLGKMGPVVLYCLSEDRCVPARICHEAVKRLSFRVGDEGKFVKKFEFAHLAEEIARQAGALLRGFYEKGVATEYKGDVDLVTEADRASEQLVVERLRAVFPRPGGDREHGSADRRRRGVRWVC